MWSCQWNLEDKNEESKKKSQPQTQANRQAVITKMESQNNLTSRTYAQITSNIISHHHIDAFHYFL